MAYSSSDGSSSDFVSCDEFDFDMNDMIGFFLKPFNMKVYGFKRSPEVIFASENTSEAALSPFSSIGAESSARSFVQIGQTIRH